MCSKTTEKNKNKKNIRQILYKNTLPDMILVSWSAQMSINNQHGQVKVSVLEYFGMKHVLFQYHTMWKMLRINSFAICQMWKLKFSH